MINFLHTFNPQPILAQIGPLAIRWYGFLIAIGACLAFGVFYYLAQKYKIKKDDIYNLIFYVVIFGLIGDRLYYVFYAWEYYSKNLLDIFKIWEGGLAIHGAMIAGLLVVWLYAKRHKLSPWLILDLMAVCLPLAMAFGRWGNYFNQELFGWPTTLPWGIPIEIIKRPAELAGFQYFQPTFLYESIFNLLLFAGLFGWHLLRLYKYKSPEKIQGLGNIALVYFMAYSAARFANEFLRIDYSPYVWGLRWAQIASIAIILICLLIIIYKTYLRIKARPKQTMPG